MNSHRTDSRVTTRGGDVKEKYKHVEVTSGHLQVSTEKTCLQERLLTTSKKNLQGKYLLAFELAGLLTIQTRIRLKKLRYESFSASTPFKGKEVKLHPGTER